MDQQYGVLHVTIRPSPFGDPYSLQLELPKQINGRIQLPKKFFGEEINKFFNAKRS